MKLKIQPSSIGFNIKESRCPVPRDHHMPQLRVLSSLCNTTNTVQRYPFCPMIFFLHSISSVPWVMEGNLLLGPNEPQSKSFWSSVSLTGSWCIKSYFVHGSVLDSCDNDDDHLKESNMRNELCRDQLISIEKEDYNSWLR